MRPSSATLVEIRLGASGDGETEKDDSIGGHALVIKHGATSVGLREGFYGNDDVHRGQAGAGEDGRTTRAAGGVRGVVIQFSVRTLAMYDRPSPRTR